MSVVQFRKEADRRMSRASTPERVETAVELIPESSLLRNIAELLNLPPKSHPTARSTFHTARRVKTSRNGITSPRKLDTTAPPSRRVQRRSEGNIVHPLSPIDALASVAAQQASPVFSSPRQPYHQAQVSPSTTVWPPFQWDASRQPPRPSSYQDERPAKRARSELLPSPQHPSPQFPPSASRPATSHNMPHGWGYNVEQSINNRQRLHSVASTWQHHNRGTSIRADDANRMSDAELLLDFARTVSARSNSHRGPRTEIAPVPQSPVSTLPTLPYVAPAGPFERVSHAGPAQLSDRTFGPPLDIPNGQHTETRHINAHHYPDFVVNLALQTQTPPHEMPRRLQTDSWPGLEPNPAEVKKNEQQLFNSQKGPLDIKVTVATISTPSQAKLQDSQKVNDTGENATRMPQSPQSLAAEPNGLTHASIDPHTRPQTDQHHKFPVNGGFTTSPKRPSSTSNIPLTSLHPEDQNGTRARSVPLQNQINAKVAAIQGVSISTPQAQINPIDEGTKCAGCDISPNSFSGEFVDWLQCNGCKQWFHLACAGFTTREVRKVDKFYCLACQPKYGKTTFVRKSSRAHTSIDYAGLNEGVWRTSDETVEHHYIKPIKEGSIKILPENFPRMTPEEVTAEYFEKCSSLGEPIVIPGYLNPRSTVPAKDASSSSSQASGDDIDFARIADDVEHSPYEQEMVADDGQDRLDMVIPQGLTVRRVAELYGADLPIEVIDVKSQEGDGSKKWTVGKWADYYEATGEKVIRNVISLEVSKSLLGRLIRRPKVVRDLDLQDAVWPSSDERRTSVGFYCLMSVADSYTDFHIDFAGSSVYYHILKGKKTFFFIPPTNKNLKKYEEWCLNKAMNSIWLPDLTKECYRVDLSPGDTMLIPSGWIHSVWTPEDSLVIGGNFLTRLHYSMQLRVVEIERTCRVPLKYRYPFFQKVMWYAMIKYLEQDPLPESVRMHFYSGNKFERKIQVYLEMNKFGPNSDAGEENYHARYYSKQELSGLPDFVSYIFRTLMIYLDRLEGFTQETRKAVTRSIPKGKGDPLELARTFAIWVAWKRGNEDIPLWAHPNSVLASKENNSLSANKEDGASENKPELLKKISIAEMKKLERAMPVKGYQPPQYPSAMQASIILDGTADEDAQMTDPNLTTTPKTSVLGPKRTACDTCRKRKMRCKHMLDSTSSARTAIGVVIDKQPNTKVRTMLAPGPNGAGVMVAGVMLSPEHIGRQRDPSMVADQTVGVDGKKGRNKACPECRRSKVGKLLLTLEPWKLTISDRGDAFMMRMATSIRSSRTNLSYREALAAKSVSLLPGTTQMGVRRRLSSIQRMTEGCFKATIQPWTACQGPYFRLQ